MATRRPSRGPARRVRMPPAPIRPRPARKFSTRHNFVKQIGESLCRLTPKPGEPHQAPLIIMSEQRRHPRVRASIPIDWGLTSQCLKHDRITSFSIGGCFVQTLEAAPPMTLVYLRFFLSAEGERIIRGEVRYHLNEVGLGVEFINLTPGDRDNFQALVDYYRNAQTQ